MCGQGACASSPSVTTESQIQHGGLAALPSSPIGRGPPSSGVPPAPIPSKIFIQIQRTQKENTESQASPISGNTRTWLIRCHKCNQDTQALHNQGPAKQCRQPVHMTAPKHIDQFPGLLHYYNLKLCLPMNADMG